MAYDLCAQRSGFCGEVHRRQPGLSSHFKLSTPAGNSGSVAGSSARITGPDATPMLGHRSPPALPRVARQMPRRKGDYGSIVTTKTAATAISTNFGMAQFPQLLAPGPSARLTTR